MKIFKPHENHIKSYENNIKSNETIWTHMKAISATVPSGTIVECSKAFLGSRDPGTCGFRDPGGILRGCETEFTGVSWSFSDLSRVLFSMIFWTSSWDPNFSDFGVNLGPTWLPTWCQNPSKFVARGVQIPSQLASYFRYPFWLILEASWIEFWWVLGAKLKAKLATKSII